EYEQARTIFASSRHPLFPCPGNHDARAAYRTALLGEDAASLLDQDGGDPVKRVHKVAGALFALCDSTIPGRDDGYLADETLSCLDAVLAAHPGVPAFLCIHHPPVLLHCPYVDSIRLFGEDRAARLVDDHPQIAAFLCGHAHTPAATTFAGRPVEALGLHEGALVLLDDVLAVDPDHGGAVVGESVEMAAVQEVAAADEL